MARSLLRNLTISLVFGSNCSLCYLSVKQKTLEAALNYRFNEPSYLENALLHPSHPSATADSQFERLEFLGDRVLNLIVAEFLFESADGKVGFLNNRLSSLISSESCLQIAKFIQLDSHLKAVYGNPKSKILADGVEALLGAVYLDGGFESCRAIVTKSWIPFLVDAGADRNINRCKNDLQNWLFSQPEKILPRYVIEDIGNDSDPKFQCIVELGVGWPSFSGNGNSKKAAEKMAASAALDWIRAQDTSTTISPSISSDTLKTINPGAVLSPKNELQEWMWQQGWLGGVGDSGPHYTVSETTTGTMPPTFQCILELRQGLRPTFSGQGQTKKRAEAKAAEEAMDWIQAHGVQGFYEDSDPI